MTHLNSNYRENNGLSEFAVSAKSSKLRVFFDRRNLKDTQMLNETPAQNNKINRINLAYSVSLEMMSDSRNTKRVVEITQAIIQT